MWISVKYADFHAINNTLCLVPLRWTVTLSDDMLPKRTSHPLHDRFRLAKWWILVGENGENIAETWTRRNEKSAIGLHTNLLILLLVNSLPEMLILLLWDEHRFYLIYELQCINLGYLNSCTHTPSRITTSKWNFWLYIFGVQFNCIKNTREICIFFSNKVLGMAIHFIWYAKHLFKICQLERKLIKP